jgi:5-methylcytosine-specific restriction endonuclease McrA
LFEAGQDSYMTAAITCPCGTRPSSKCKTCVRAKDKARHSTEKYRAKSRVRYAANPEQHRAKSRARRKNNPEKVRAADRAWYARHPDKVRRKNRERYWADPDKDRALSKAYRDAHREKVRATTREWQRAHPAEMRAHNQKRRALKLEAAVLPFTAAELKKHLARFGNKCAYCRGPQEHVDHVVPLVRGGDHALWNLAAACARCNLAKNASPPAEFIARVPNGLDQARAHGHWIALRLLEQEAKGVGMSVVLIR